MRPFEILHRKRSQHTHCNKRCEEIEKRSVQVNPSVICRIAQLIGEQGGDSKRENGIGSRYSKIDDYLFVQLQI